MGAGGRVARTRSGSRCGAVASDVEVRRTCRPVLPALAECRARGAEIVLTNKTPLPAAVLERLPGLRYIGVLATGYNIVDVAAATRLGITVTNVPTYGTVSVAQFVFALLLELCHNVK